MPKCSTSLWSADLTNLAAEIKRVEPYSDSFHIDVSDGSLVPSLLFFPDLVKAMRPHTRLPFDVHLIVADPLRWVEAFANAGADWITFYLSETIDPRAVIAAIKSFDKKVGLSFRVEDTLDIFEPFWNDLDYITVMGTSTGIKGIGNDPTTPNRIRQTRSYIDDHALPTQILADGGIRRETVPGLCAAGTDYVVPGSLMFKEDPLEIHRWLATL